MAKSVGPVATYDFVYFLASNFVHFKSGFANEAWMDKSDE